VTAAAHNYEDLHILVDLLRPEQADALRAYVLQLVGAGSRPAETPPMPTDVTPDDEGSGARRYRRLSFAGSISADADLAERSEEILDEIIRGNAE
jgi:hypothetical protein